MVNSIFILDKLYNTTRILTGSKRSQRMFWEDTYTQEFDTGAETFEFSCYADETIAEGNFVAFRYNNQYKLFTIMDMEVEHSQGNLVAHCYCETAALALLNNHIRPFSGEMNCVKFFQHILQDTNWRIGRYSTSLQDKIANVDVTKVQSVWSLIEDYKDIFECEINVYITYSNGTVTGQYIDIFSDGGLGSPTKKRFEYGRNVTGITKQRDLYDWCTAIIVDCDCDVSELIVKESDGYGFTKSAGDVILDDNANKIYNAGQKHVFGVYSGEETEPIDACIAAWKELQKRKEPKFDYEVTTALTSEEYDQIHLGDTVYVIDHSYTPPLFLEARVGKLELSFTDRTQNKCTLTNYKEIKSKLLDASYIRLTGTITDIVNAFFPIGPDGIADGAIVDGKIDTKYYQEITADIVSAGIGAFEELYAGKMTVINADIENLYAGYAEIDNLKAGFADINQLKADVADIGLLVNGHLTSDNIQSMVITADKFTVEEAFIKDAMIDTVNARKINSGVLNTNNISIQSEDGGMLLQGNLQQFKDKDGHVRIQIGKDATGNFTFCLFSQDGVGVLLDEDGLHAGAIADGLIVDAMINENANIDGGKIDITSLFTEMNKNGSTLKSSKIYLDNQAQTLDVAFNQLKTKVDTISEITVDGDLASVIEQVISNTTRLTFAEGVIQQLISDTTITSENGQTVQLKDDYNQTKKTVSSNTQKIGSLTTNLSDVTSKQSTLEQTLDSLSSTISETYVTKDNIGDGVVNCIPHTDFAVKNVLDNWKCWSTAADTYITTSTWSTSSIGGKLAYGQKVLRLRLNTEEANKAEETYAGCSPRNTMTLLKGEKYTFSSYVHVGEDADYGWIRIYAMKEGTNEVLRELHRVDFPRSTAYYRTEFTFETIEETSTYDFRFYVAKKADAVANSLMEIYHPMLAIGDKPVVWRSASEDVETSVTSSMSTAIKQAVDGITLDVSNTYATKTSLNSTKSDLSSLSDDVKDLDRDIKDLGDELERSYSTTTEMNTAIAASASGLTARVEKVETRVTKNYNNLIVNSAMKNNKDGWYLNEPSLVGRTTTTSDRLEDNHSIRLNCNTTPVYANTKRIKVNPGEKYTVGMWGMCGQYNNYLRVYSLFCETDALDNSYIDTPVVMSYYYSDSPNWQYKKATFTIPEGVSYLAIKVRAESTKTTDTYDGRAWFSCLMLVKGEEIASWTGNSSDNYDEFTRRMNSAELKITNDAIITAVSSTYATKKEMDNLSDKYATKNEVSSVSSRVTQNADKITWVVKSGTSASNMTLTDKVYSLVAQNIKLKAANIDLHGYVTANKNFTIDTAGNMTAKNATFSGNVTSSTFKTAEVNKKYVYLKTSDLSVWNNSKRILSLGLRQITANDAAETTVEAPTLYMGADGINLSGGTGYTSKTGRYYGRIVAYNHENIQDDGSEFKDMPYMEWNFNTKYTSTNGNPTASQIRMLANGNMHIAAVDTVEIRSHFKDNAFMGGIAERTVATFTGNQYGDYYSDCMNIRAISNIWNGQGLILVDRFFASDGEGYGDREQEGWQTAVSIDSAYNDDGSRNRAFKPMLDGTVNLGRNSSRWAKIYCETGTISTSDRRAKENIKYISNVQNTRAATNGNYIDDVVEYVKNIPYATFNMKEKTEANIGFILQDLIEMNPDLTNELLLDEPTILEGKVDEDIPLLGYREANYVNMLGVAVQYLLKKVEELEAK